MSTLNLGKINIQAGVPGLNRNDAYKIRIPLPSLEVQQKLVAEAEEEQKIIDANKKLIEIMKGKIKKVFRRAIQEKYKKVGDKFMTKEEIIKYISETVNYCIADGNTYLYAKCVPTFTEDNEKITIGGGNFTVLLSTLSCIEFLATINAILQAKEGEFYTADEIKHTREVKNSLEDSVKKLGGLRKGTGEILRSFLEETSKLTGIDKKGAGDLQTVRNKLAHEFTPKIIPAAGIAPTPGADFVKIISGYKEKSVFCSTSKGAGIDSNALNHKLSALLQYVTEGIEVLKPTDKKLKNISNYIQIQNNTIRWSVRSTTHKH